LNTGLIGLEHAMARWPWIERTFRFDYPVGKFPDLLERVRGTPARLEQRLRGVAESVLTGNDGKGWTIKQNVGHLLDLEPVHARRLEQILAGEETLLAADITNRRTHEAGFNAWPIQKLLGEFRSARQALVTSFAAAPDADWGRTGMHQRLKQSMRIVDLLCFTADHDDYHLARISELLRVLRDAR
jgi:uncharacterized damage-inducible protein DinB